VDLTHLFSSPIRLSKQICLIFGKNTQVAKIFFLLFSQKMGREEEGYTPQRHAETKTYKKSAQKWQFRFLIDEKSNIFRTAKRESSAIQ